MMTILSPIKTTDLSEARLWVEDKTTLWLDIRDQISFDESHIIGAIHLNVEVMSKLDKINPDTRIVVCCYHGVSSKSLANYLVSEKGFEQVYSLNGGFAAWASAYPELCEKI